jgi:hypothetical protein
MPGQLGLWFRSTAAGMLFFASSWAEAVAPAGPGYSIAAGRMPISAKPFWAWIDLITPLRSARRRVKIRSQLIGPSRSLRWSLACFR